MKLRFSHLVWTMAFAAFLAGCAAGGGRSNPFAGGSTGGSEIKIFVTNLAFSDATLYGIANGARHRLGRVTGKMEVELTMPMRQSSELYLEIDFLAGPKCLTERMIVDPGEHLELTIQNENLSWNCRGP